MKPVSVLFLLCYGFPSLAVAGSPLLHSDLPCHMAIPHVPDGDVAYEPGVDTQGLAVAPADIPQNMESDTPPDLQFDLQSPLAAHHAAGSDSRDLSETRLNIGRVHLHDDQADVEVLGKDALLDGQTELCH